MVTGIEANRRGDVILRFGSPHEVFRVMARASCSLSAMRILEKDQVTRRKNATESEYHFCRNAF